MKGESIAVLILSQIASNGGWIWWKSGLPDNPLVAIPIMAGVFASVIIGIAIYESWE